MTVAMIEEAVGLIPDYNSDRHKWLGELGFHHHNRYERLKNVADLDDATEVISKAVHLTPDRHPNKSILFNILASYYKTRHEELDYLEDIHKVIRWN